MHIGIAGNIGSGKTTLTTLLARHYGWTPKFESVTYKPTIPTWQTTTPISSAGPSPWKCTS